MEFRALADEKVSRRPLSSRHTQWATATAKWLTASGFRPNQISILSLFCSIIAGAALLAARESIAPAHGLLFLTAALFIQLRLLCNLFDGMVAVEGGFRTKSGEIFNELPDRFSDAIILVCASHSVPATSFQHALGWLAAVLSVLTAYVRALGASCGASQQFVGPMAKPQRMALLTVVCVIMSVLAFVGKSLNLIPSALGIICAGCIATIVRRTVRIVKELESR